MPRARGLSMALHHYKSGEISRLAPVDDATARTTALARTPSFEAIHLVVRAGDRLPSHQVAGSMTLYCIAGHIRFEGGSPPELKTGDWLYLAPGTPHEVEAITDSALLLTILFDRPGDGTAPPTRAA